MHYSKYTSRCATIVLNRVVIEDNSPFGVQFSAHTTVSMFNLDPYEATFHLLVQVSSSSLNSMNLEQG